MDAVFDKENRQIPDQTPIELPLGYSPPESMEAMIARIVKVNEDMKARKDVESLDEAEDFNVGDEDFAGDSKYTWTELQEEQLKQAFEDKANRIPASDEDDQDDDGEPLTAENLAEEAADKKRAIKEAKAKKKKDAQPSDQ